MKIEVKGKHGILNIYTDKVPSEVAVAALCEDLYAEQQQLIKTMRAMLYRPPTMREVKR